MSSAPLDFQRVHELRQRRLVAKRGGADDRTFEARARSAASPGVWNSGPATTSKLRSLKADAITFAPRSWPSWPSFATISFGRLPSEVETSPIRDAKDLYFGSS